MVFLFQKTATWCWNRTFLILVTILILGSSSVQGGLCEVETGLSNIIVDIEESRGKEISQPTIPEELPISGDPFTEVALDLVFTSRKPVFILNGKRLQLLEPLDRDSDNLSHIVFQLTCTVKGASRKRTIPVIVRVSDINDNAPKFVGTPYETTVAELTPIGTTIFKGVRATDADAGVNGLVEYRVVPGSGKGLSTHDGVGRNRVTISDGYEFFAINLPHQGQVTVNRSLDYEKTQRYLVTIVASDRARNASDRFTSTTTLTVNVRDDDDLDPSFIYQGCMLLDGACINPEYKTSVSSGIVSGVLSVSPEKIQAVDMDSINAPIKYSFLSGQPSNFKEFFQIDSDSGAVRQKKAVDTSVTKYFDIIVKAEEVSEARRFAVAKLLITVKPVDANPPQLHATAIEGSVYENAPVGTQILDSNKMPIKFTVTDPDLEPDDPKPSYIFELTSDYFVIDGQGLLVVAHEGLDRDPPSPGIFKFQIVARETSGLNAASSPLSMSITLLDVNDNAPVLPSIPPVSVEAGEGKRDVYKVVAMDNDDGENALVSYGIFHISNNGRGKFKIDPHTGLITTSGKLNSGEQYSITVQASDTGGKTAQTIVEVLITPGPNTKSPVFSQPVYDVQVSEGASINSTVVTVHAVDPENDPVTYSILTGNDLKQFGIGYDSGVISVIRKLDREDLTRYQLLVKAGDTGGLSSTATVNIKVTDINDKNPVFVDLPYEFKVKEGVKNKTVGIVHATDADEGVNAQVTYSLPEDVPFDVDSVSGEVVTKRELDFENQTVYRFVVTARDGAADPRIATATVTVSVIDIEDEKPVFNILEYRSSVPENVPDYLIVQVKAEDPDTLEKVTYVLKQGPTDLFSVDAVTGAVRCTRGLDYERESNYTLIVGTLENQSNEKGATTRILVQVEDRNDIPPVFNTVPRPITLEDELAIGTKVTSLTATDSDGTAPNNKVRYELVGRHKAAKYFQVDPDTGSVQVRDDLRKETATEYQIDVRAYDLGDPSLSSVTTVPIYIRHSATVSPDIGLGFADDFYAGEIPENGTAGQLIKILALVNSRSAHNNVVPLTCKIISGDNEGLFVANVTADRNCEVRLKKAALDFETKEEYRLGIKVETLSGAVHPDRSMTTLKIAILDINDNAPEFQFPKQYPVYFAAIARDTQLSGFIITVKALDKDSGKYGQISYEILDSDYFTIDNATGIIRTRKLLDKYPAEELPITFHVRAKDNYLSLNDSLVQTAKVVVNLIEDDSRVVLVVGDAKQESFQENHNRLVEILEDHSKLIIGIEKFSPHKFLNDNRSLEIDSSSTDVWFYAIDPESELILDRNNSKVLKSILSASAISNITFDVSANFAVTATEVRAPLMEVKTITTLATVSWDIFPYTIIIIALLVLVLGIAGIVYICISWARYKASKEQAARSNLYSIPHTRYDPVFVEPNNLKEYETQVLQMSVPLDDSESYNDMQLDFSAKNHAFSLENVNYISKEESTRPGSIMDTLSRQNNHNLLNNETGIYQNSHSPYPRSDDLLSSNVNISSTNDNVTFREKKDYTHLGYSDRSPVEATTEL